MKKITINLFRYVPYNTNNLEWAKRIYSNKEYERAGKKIIDSTIADSEKDDAYKIVNNWRAVHAFPLNTFQNRLRVKAREIDNNSIVAQRIKRLSSINRKLDKWGLCQIQDIAGCRAIVNSVDEVRALRDSYKSSKFKHELWRIDDYMDGKPKASGYRSVHLVYKYFSDRNVTYNNLKIELQIRSRYQHAWATAVETVDVFTKQTLKFNSGDKKWERFFAVMSAYIAALEGTTPVPNASMFVLDLIPEIAQLERELKVRKLLMGWAKTIDEDFFNTTEKYGYYYIISLYDTTHIIDMVVYPKHDYEKAMERYLREERLATITTANVVLVSVDSIKSLRQAYPNYFYDTSIFLGLLEQAINTGIE